jgi:hypothetical protein
VCFVVVLCFVVDLCFVVVCINVVDIELSLSNERLCSTVRL